MSTRKEIIELLRQVANETSSHRNLWIMDEDWVELINKTHPDFALDVKKLNEALLWDPSTHHFIRNLDGAVNKTGIYCNNKKLTSKSLDDGGWEIVKRRDKKFYLVADEGTTVQWDNNITESQVHPSMVPDDDDCGRSNVLKTPTATGKRKRQSFPQQAQAEEVTVEKDIMFGV